jgi:hypothetical protein
MTPPRAVVPLRAEAQALNADLFSTQALLQRRHDLHAHVRAVRLREAHRERPLRHVVR